MSRTPNSGVHLSRDFQYKSIEALLDRILRQPAADGSARCAQEQLEPREGHRDTWSPSPPKTAIRFFNDTLRVEAPPLSSGPPEVPGAPARLSK